MRCWWQETEHHSSARHSSSSSIGYTILIPQRNKPDNKVYCINSNFSYFHRPNTPFSWLFSDNCVQIQHSTTIFNKISITSKIQRCNRTRARVLLQISEWCFSVQVEFNLNTQKQLGLISNSQIRWIFCKYVTSIKMTFCLASFLAISIWVKGGVAFALNVT